MRRRKIEDPPMVSRWLSAPRRSNYDDDFQPLCCPSRPVGILTACTQSGALYALPVSAKRSADRTSPHVAGELAEHDAAVDEVYRQLITKASTTSPVKSKKMVRAQEA